MNTVRMLKTYARAVSSGCWDKMPAEMVHTVMVANNRILKAAIIENGGSITISPDAIHEMLTNHSHVMAVANEDGSLTVTLAPKEAILATPEVMAL